MKIDNNITECPYCGHDEYYIKQYHSGYGTYYIRYDGEETENGDIYCALNDKTVSKYAWCGCCHKRLFKLEGDV